jgi:hypothetical protein
MPSNVVETITLSGFSALVKRTQRKRSVGFRVADGKVLVSAPTSIAAHELRQLLEAKSRWILTKLALQSQTVVQAKRHYVTGEQLAYLDVILVLQVREGAFKALHVDQQIVISLPQAKPDWVRSALVRWYKQQAQQHFAQRVAHFSPMVGAWPASIQIKTYRARWGSCNSKGQLQFNWKLMMAPQAVVDSVVVHELCHLLHLHHGPEFWAQVRRVLPNYRDAKQWLKEEGHGLTLD